jgi:methylglutaconyl-CoA hydratase|tara:strand:- start:78 stop:803 length:726 start_codon:yes stop_codon:yes gene_type:complete
MENQIPLIVDRRGTVLTLTFNNISKKNALNSEMMGAMTAAIEESSNYEELRAIVIRGEGSVFCSGADLNEWDPSQLQLLLRTIVDCSIPTIAEVHGACLGGGMGIICACDFIISKENTLFGFPEIRIGMIPAVILPYVNRKLTLSKIRELFITGVKFDNEAAKSFGLLYHDNLSELISTIEKGAPQAQKTIKSLLNGDILSKPMDERDRELETLISGIKEGKECQEGINSFMEKRKPEWVK